MPTIRQRAIEGLHPGDTFTVTRTFTEDLTRAFGALSRDFNPVHYDQRFTSAKGFDGLICHGLLVGSLGLTVAMVLCGAAYFAATTLPALQPQWRDMDRRPERELVEAA